MTRRAPERPIRRLASARLVLPALVLLLGGPLAAPAEGQTPRSYRDGKDAAEAGRWSAAEKAMRAAIAEDPEARRRTFSRYTPYYYLGVALAEQGDCRGALEAWRLTDRYGALREGGDEERDLEQRRDRCSQLIDDVKRVIETVELALDDAEEAATALGRLSRQETLAPLWDEGDPSFADRQASAAAVLEKARAKAARGREQLDLDLLAEASYEASEATRAYQAATLEAESRLSAVSEAVSSAVAELDAAEKEARTVLRSVRAVAPYPPRLGRQVRTLRRVIARSDDERDSASPEALSALAAEMRREAEVLAPLAVGPPPALRDAGAAFLANDFQGVLDLLAEPDFRTAKERFHAGLLRAAALHGQYVTGGEVDADLLADSRAEIAALPALGEDLGAPGPRFFSPRFRALYDDTLQRPPADGGDATPDPGGP